jgi:hypothetical protein
MCVIRDDRSTPKTPRWWAVAPPTPAEAPQAKRRTAARSRGSTALIFAAALGFVGAALILLLRVGRQVGGYEPAVVSLAPSEPAAPPSRPLEAAPVATWGASGPNDAGAPSAIDAGAKGPPTERKRGPGRHAPREVFRKPGF